MIQPTVAAINDAVCRHYGLSRDEFTSPSKLRRIARPRQVAICLSDRLTRHTRLRIGQFYGFDHTTVLHACREVDRRCIADPVTGQAVRSLTKQLLFERRGF